MAIVKTLKEEHIRNGQKSEVPVYPVTVAKAVFIGDKNLETVLQDLQLGAGGAANAEYIKGGYIKLIIENVPYLIPAFQYVQPELPEVQSISGDDRSASRTVTFKTNSGTLRYTLDGSEPNASSPVLGNSITLEATTESRYTDYILKVVSEVHGVCSLVTSVQVRTARHLPIPVVTVSGTPYDSTRTVNVTLNTSTSYRLEMYVPGSGTRTFTQNFPFSTSHEGIVITAYASGEDWEPSSTTFDLKVNMPAVIFGVYNGNYLMEIPLKGTSFPNGPVNITVDDYLSQAVITPDTGIDDPELAAQYAFGDNEQTGMLYGQIIFKYPKSLYNQGLSDIQQGGFSCLGDDSDSQFRRTYTEEDNYIVYRENVQDYSGGISGVQFSFIP